LQQSIGLGDAPKYPDSFHCRTANNRLKGDLDTLLSALAEQVLPIVLKVDDYELHRNIEDQPDLTLMDVQIPDPNDIAAT
jgi:hypothetical protein